jgi:aqualysin 1
VTRTKKTSFTFLVALLALAALAAMSAVGAGASAGGRYIVVLKAGTSNPSAAASDNGRRYGASVGSVYGHALKGYSAAIPDGKVDDVRRDSRVAYVERDGTVATAQTLPWGIDKVDADLSSTAAGNGSGAVSNVHVYVIDTGIDASHRDLNVAGGNVNFAGGKNSDCNGHGTHVAGTVAARDNSVDVVGVAPGAPLTGVKVLGCSGSGSTSGVIRGIDWVTAHAAKPAVANMSLGGSASQALDDAVRNSAATGVVYSIAAGNDGADACTHSPARAGTASGVITVAATDQSDAEASWSNYGNCVDIWAPGVSILSTRRSGGTTTMSGTSMATPHVTGGSALYLSTHTGSSQGQVESALESAATTTSRSSKDGRTITRLNVGGF